MAVVVNASLRRFSRARQTLNFGEALTRCIDRWANLLVVRDHGKGAPSYKEGEADPVHMVVVDTAAMPDDPNTTAPTSRIKAEPFGGVVLYWRPSAAGATTHTHIDLTVWALADTGDWVTIASASDLLPFVEFSVPGTGYRAIFVQVTDAKHGADGNLDMLLAGD